jgi:hypothetical protein
MPPSILKPRANATLWIATLSLLLFTFTVAAGAAPRPKAAAPIPAGSGSGLAAVYVDQTGASVSRVDPKIDFSWGQGAPAPSLRADDFSVRWTGELEPRHSETYTISTVSDDGIRLWLGGDRSRRGAPVPDQDRVLRAIRCGDCSTLVGE